MSLHHKGSNPGNEKKHVETEFLGKIPNIPLSDKGTILAIHWWHILILSTLIFTGIVKCTPAPFSC